MPPPSPNRDHGGRLLIATLTLFAVAVGGIGGYFLDRQKGHIRLSAREELGAIADLKVESIVRWRQERLADGLWIVEASDYATEARDIFSHPQDAGRRASSERWLDGWHRINAYRRVLLLDPTLQVRLAMPASVASVAGLAEAGPTSAASSPSGPRSATPATISHAEPGSATALEPTSRAAAADALKQRAVIMVDLHRDAASNQVVMDIAIPLVPHDGSNEPTGVLLFEIDPEQFLFPHLKTWPTSSRTAETLLVRREGDDVVFLNELRHRSGTALSLRIPLKLRDVAAVQAVLGDTAVVQSIDYRGRQVLAALRSIPDSPWFIIAKQDLAEIDAPLRQWALMLSIIALLLVGTATAVVGFVWRTREARFTREEMAERAHAEEELRASEAMLNETGKTGRIGGWSIDLRTGSLRWTREIYTLHEVADDFEPTVEAALGFYAPESQPIIQQAVDRAIKNGEPFNLELEIVTARNRRLWVQAIGQAVHENGRATVVSGTFQDITERKKARQERDQLMLELERKNEELESIIYVASHDLRGPLVNAQGFGQRLEKACADLVAKSVPARDAAEGPPEVERISKSLHYIRSSVDKMNGLISGLLRVSRLGRIAVNIQTIDMDRLLQLAASTLEFQIQQAGAAMRIDPLPSCQGDPELLGQVFANLLDNAIKYRAPDRPLSIRVSGQVDGRESVYCVEDTGMGIAAEHQNKVWEMFHRLHPEGPATGEGLGLKIVRRILDRHHGRIWMESTFGQGTRFFVALQSDAVSDGASMPKQA